MKTILIVDDDPKLLSCLENLMVRSGYSVIPASNASSALAVIRSRPAVDLIITDYQMPGMNGLELVAMLKQIIPSVPVIMFSGFTEVDVYLKAQALGVAEYVEKPASPHVLKRVVEQVLKLSPQAEAGSQEKLSGFATTS